MYLYPNNFDKMRVKFAVQIFSHTTASAIRAVCIDPNDNLFSPSEIIKYALPTAKICEMFNNCFDCFNKIPFFNKDKEGQKIGYIDSYDYLKNDMLKFLYSLEYNSDAKCINGFIQTINAVLMIADATFLTDPTLNHICVSRLIKILLKICLAR